MTAQRQGVSLIVTLRNESRSLRELWWSIAAQTRLPDEVVVVDGGSDDDTVELIRTLPEPVPVKLKEVPGANIARGRNIAIEMAGHDIIAVTDGGCVLDPHWLERLVQPLEDDPRLELAAGFYQPLVGNWMQGVVACATLPRSDELKAGFLPSSRSIAFRREVWRDVGGYPEWLAIGEDMYFNHAWRDAGVRYRVVPEAVTYWRQRGTMAKVLKQYFRYAEGDGIGGMYPERHLIRYATYGWLALGGTLKGRVPFYVPLTLLAGGGYCQGKWRRIPTFMRAYPSSARVAAIPAVPVVLAAIDGAKMAGYLSGLWKRANGANRGKGS
ncbi:MAG: glycosyltransferase [Candidatus Geothermincolia bacterium]